MVQHFIEQVTRWDVRVFDRIFGDAHRKSWRRFFYALSRSADASSCALMGLVWVVLQHSSAPFVAGGVIAFGLELFLYYLVKKNVRRPRPCYRLRGVPALIAPPDEFSFPSGHTAAAFLVATLLASAVPVLAVPVFLWAALVGFSRVYLGVHYPTDVLAGMVLGLVSAQVGLWTMGTMI